MEPPGSGALVASLGSRVPSLFREAFVERFEGATATPPPPPRPRSAVQPVADKPQHIVRDHESCHNEEIPTSALLVLAPLPPLAHRASYPPQQRQ